MHVGADAFDEQTRAARDLASKPTLHSAIPRPADDEPPQDDAPLPEPVTRLAPWHGFAKGPTAGNFLHDQLEWLAAEGFVLGQGQARRLQRACERAGFADQAAEVQDWLARVVRQPLEGPGVPLQALDRVLPEMEFWLPAAQLDTPAIDQLCREHLLPGVARPALPQSQLHGMLMGFADLVFEHDGRYWVLDYKSEWQPERRAALQDQMRMYRAAVQAAYPQAVVRAAYLTAQGRLVEVE